MLDFHERADVVLDAADGLPEINRIHQHCLKKHFLRNQTSQKTHTSGWTFFWIQVSWGSPCIEPVSLWWVFLSNHLASLPRHLANLPWRTPAIEEKAISHVWAYILMQWVISHCVDKLDVYLGVSKFVLSVIYLNGRQQLFTRLLAINKLSFWNDAGIQEAVSDKTKEKSLTVGIISVHRMLQEQL